jgi:hypothetical protein
MKKKIVKRLIATLWQQVEDAAMHGNLKEFEYGG